MVLVDGCASGQEMGMQRRWNLSRWRMTSLSDNEVSLVMMIFYDIIRMIVLIVIFLYRGIPFTTLNVLRMGTLVLNIFQIPNLSLNIVIHDIQL